MIAIDSNILIYAHRRDSPWHDRATARLKELAEGRAVWGLPWPCLHEFLAIATHPRIYAPPSTLKQGIAQVEAWLSSPSAILLSETEDYWSIFGNVLAASRVTGPRVHDARIAALCLAHGVRELWTADRDFSAFSDLTVRNPLAE
ncbi:MAG TPA: VapC toxin family PIN domain ribonuclease [Alphaproteobacteria bacterium]|nr:VapC toxin family PIN domain ribonuclease [Alphaproteobacteria bacterium]HAJ45853.1 VapC toxin family PIN domain ribonuclease [Alphaproteobacteria bacterium]